MTLYQDDMLVEIPTEDQAVEPLNALKPLNRDKLLLSAQAIRISELERENQEMRDAIRTLVSYAQEEP